MRTLALVILLAGCGTIPPDIAQGNFASTEHTAGNFKGAAEGAAAYCAGRGMQVKHLETAMPLFGRPVSRFECVRS